MFTLLRKILNKGERECSVKQGPVAFTVTPSYHTSGHRHAITLFNVLHVIDMP